MFWGAHQVQREHFIFLLGLTMVLDKLRALPRTQLEHPEGLHCKERSLALSMAFWSGSLAYLIDEPVTSFQEAPRFSGMFENHAESKD